MNRNAFLGCWLAWTVIALPLRAQDEPRQYKKFAIEPNIEKLFKDRLQLEKDLGPLKDLIKKLAANPGKAPLDPAKLKDIELDDKLKSAVKDWMANDPQLRDAVEEWMKKNPSAKQPDEVKKFQGELNEILKDAAKPQLNMVEPPKVNVEPPKANADPLAKLTEQAMKRAENSRIGEWLRESPAWNQAIDDLRSAIGSPDTSGVRLGDWQGFFKIPEGGGMWQLGEGTFEWIHDLPRPNFESWTPALPNFGKVPAPAINMPSLPEGSSLPSVGTAGTWILLAVFCLLITWQLLRLTRPGAVAAYAEAKLGPWPVRPEAVSTRSELVQAFDYLALLTLGLDVRSWNHHAIARRWSLVAPTCAISARALALLYEQARYTVGTEALIDQDRDQARQSLLQIAEAM